MISQIEDFIKFDKRTKVPLNRFKRYVTQIKNKNVFNLIDLPNFRGIKEIEQIVSMFDVPHLISIESDFDRLVYIVNEVIPTFKSFIIGNQFRYQYKRPTFISLSGTSIMIGSSQIMFLTTGADYFKYIPLGSPNINVWEEMRPLNIIYHDSKEYTTYMNRGTIHFSSDLPNVFVLGIDIVMLLMHYSKIKMLLSENISFDEYFKEYIWKNVDNDLKDIWILNLVNEVVTILTSGDITLNSRDDIFEILKTGFLSSNMGYYNFLKAEFEQSIGDIIKLVDDCSMGKYYPETILNSITLTNGNSIISHIQLMYDKFDIEDNTINRWAIFVKDIFFIKLLISVFILQPGYSETKSLLLNLRIIVRRYKNSRFWNFIKNSSLKAYCEKEISNIESMIDLVRQ